VTLPGLARDTRRPTATAVWSLAVVVLVAVNLRPAVVAVSPVLGRITDEFGLSATAAGLLTTIPVVCFGALAPLAAGSARRHGLELTTVAAIVVLSLGSFVRLVPDLFGLYLGTILVGAGIAVGNVVVPAVVKREFLGRPGPMMGLYSAALSAGAAAAAGLTVPLADAAGSWRAALAWWGLAAAAALPLVWFWTVRRRRRDGGRAHPVPRPESGLWRSPLAWQITVFMGLQSFGFYATTAWLPEILVDRGVGEARAGVLLSLSAIAGLVSSLFVPALATRRPAQVGWGVGICVVSCLGLTALLLQWGPPLFAVLVVGLGQGGAMALALTFFAVRAANARVTTQISGMAQAGGYLFAAFGPVSVGALHDITGGWTASLALLVVFAALQSIAGGLCGRQRLLRDAH
jgi:CP family cyanate transporter-like MFS transporter